MLDFPIIAVPLLKENTSKQHVKLTIPLCEEGVLHQTKSLPQHLKLPLSQGLGQNVCHLKI
jgi:hypothetical protein